MPCKFTVILYLLIKHGALTSTNRTTSLSLVSLLLFFICW